MGEKQLHLLSFAARDEIFRCIGDASGYVAGSLMDAADDLPIRRAGAGTGCAVGLARALDDGVGLGYPRSLLGESTPFTE